MARTRLLETAFIAWGMGSIVSYFIIAFFANSGIDSYQVYTISFATTFIASVFGYFSLRGVVQSIRAKNWVFLCAVLILGRFVYKVVELCLSFGKLFTPQRFILARGSIVAFTISSLVALTLFWLIIQKGASIPDSRLSRIFLFFDEHACGLLLMAMFFVVYFLLANVFNHQDFNTNNIFFAADTYSWVGRLAAQDGNLMGMRAIHPLAFLILRSTIFLLSLFFGLDPFNIVLISLSMIGGAGIFLVWIFLFHFIRSQNEAFLFATVFGISTAHMLFSSIIESYAFSAFFLILFYVLLCRRVSLVQLVASGIGVFGITISNVVQALIGSLLFDLNVKQTLLFFTLVVVIGAGLSFVNQSFYPNSELFFDPVAYQVESQFYVDITNPLNLWQRTRLLGADIFLYSVVAPQPFVRAYHRDDRTEFPKFNFMQGSRLSRFVGLGKVAVWFWLGILLAGICLFWRSLIREGFSESNRLSLAFLCCLAFSFLFHLFYGFEPFLYAVNWTFALVFFTALAWRSLAENRAVQITLLILIALLTLNNLSFVYFLMSRLSPFIPS